MCSLDFDKYEIRCILAHKCCFVGGACFLLLLSKEIFLANGNEEHKKYRERSFLPQMKLKSITYEALSGTARKKSIKDRTEILRTIFCCSDEVL